MPPDLIQIFPVSSTLLPDDFVCPPADALPHLIRSSATLSRRHPYLADLAEIELQIHELNQRPPASPKTVEHLQIRPGVTLLEVGWNSLPELINNQQIEPQAESSLILLVPPTATAPSRALTPSGHQLLAMKIAVEHLDPKTVAAEGNVPVGVIDRLITAAVRDGLLLAPAPALVRPPSFFPAEPRFHHRLRADVFTLQWHITQACDLLCRHCYDRSSRTAVSADQGRLVLDRFYDFCQANHVRGQVSFTGGNPLLHRHFFDLYRGAAERGFMVAILGNPTDRQTLESLVALTKPEFYQVSLEGLPEHNDFIRGIGHFQRVMAFLDVARELRIYTMVMLTLTRDNQDQVLPLAEMLRHRVDLFTFNRLAMMGEGAALASAPVENYQTFLTKYLQAAAENPIMSLKDSLFNIILDQDGRPPGGGCAGFGCGAAFNFVSLLPDGEVHACRKLPSLLGNLHEQTLLEIYRSPLAAAFRQGSSACRPCPLRPVCRGCPAVVAGLGGDIFTTIDPYCFYRR